MAKTLAQVQARVYSILGVSDTKAAKGQYSRDQVTAQANTAQRFIVKGAIPASLGGLVKRSTQAFTVGHAIGEFTKSAAGSGRLLAVAEGTDYTDEVPILSFDEWMDLAKSEGFPNSDRRSHFATELGDKVMIRPAIPAYTSFIEVYVDDSTDMEDQADVISLPDDWFEWLSICTAEMLLLNARDFDKLGEVRNTKTGWSAQFKTQYGMNPPSIEAPAEAGKIV